MSLMNGIPAKNPEDFLPRQVKMLHDLGDYELTLPEWLGDWDVFAAWEAERFKSMQANLTKGDILFDIGAERGWQSAQYAKYLVDPENMVLFEPGKEFWPGIKTVWDMNFKKKPKATCAALVGEETKGKPEIDIENWPVEVRGKETSNMAYAYLHDHSFLPQITIDDFVSITGIVPKALTMDTEGAELFVLRGAKKTIEEHKPIIWLSEHVELQEKFFGLGKDVIPEIMKEYGYKGTYLGWDHEAHWIYQP